MKYREVTVLNRETFQVPENIRRLDSKKNHGWQVRYGQWKMFSDHSNDGSGAKASLRAATEELLKRIDALQAPTGLKTEVVSWKSNALPVGISGPVRYLRKGRRVAEFNFVISIPRFGENGTSRAVYIGTENTMTKERVKVALAKAVDIRKQAESEFQSGKTQEKRKLSRKRES